MMRLHHLKAVQRFGEKPFLAWVLRISGGSNDDMQGMECLPGAVAIATVTQETRFHNAADHHLSPRETVRGRAYTLQK